jgi:hypothetical protein
MFRREWSDSVPPRVTAGFAKKPLPHPYGQKLVRIYSVPLLHQHADETDPLTATLAKTGFI